MDMGGRKLTAIVPVPSVWHIPRRPCSLLAHWFLSLGC
jgi:hypothetical protein